METKLNNPPAFPRIDPTTNESGMTLRDYFAAKAMQGLMTTQHIEGSPNSASVAVWAYSVADEMLKERIK